MSASSDQTPALCAFLPPPSARRRLRAVNGLHGLASLATVACGPFSDSPPVRGYYSPEGTEDKGEPKMVADEAHGGRGRGVDIRVVATSRPGEVCARLKGEL